MKTMALSLYQKKILLVEDDDIFDLWIGIVLNRLDITDYQRVKTVEEALIALENDTPDLIISDIYLEGKLTGVDFLKKIQQFSVPIIVITSSTSIELYREVQLIENVIYLVKPFQPLTLIAAIENLLHSDKQYASKLKEPFIFIKMADNKNTKVFMSDIIYLESDRNYTYIYTIQRKFVLIKTLSKVLEELDKRFIRCHRTYAVNKQHIVSWSAIQIQLEKTIIPIGRSYQKEIKNEINISQKEKT